MKPASHRLLFLFKCDKMTRKRRPAFSRLEVGWRPAGGWVEAGWRRAGGLLEVGWRPAGQSDLKRLKAAAFSSVPT